MSPRQALASTLHIFIVLAFFVAGLFFVMLPYLPEIRTEIFEKSTLIGLILFITSLVLLFGFYALDRGKYLVIRMGVSVDINLIRQNVEDCIARQFAKKIFLSDVEIGPKSLIEISVSLGPLREDAREELFVEAEKQFTLLLKQRFGYSKPFRLIIRL